MTTTTSMRSTATNRRRSPVIIGLCLVDAALMVISGFIHLHLERGPYHEVKTINWLFIVQFISCLVAAAALLVTRHFIVAVGGVALMGGTIVGFILARTSGIFGFHLTFSTTLANEALVVEAVAVVLLAVTSWMLWRRD
jgi:heme/copper-type cytochrome/quinol oxidase subunit 4